MREPSLGPARILLPTVPLGQWCVIACDQFTSRPDYWREAAAAAGDGPSALGMICPECRLLEENPPAPEKAAEEIARAMEAALAGGALRPAAGGMIYLERTLPSGKVRRGLMAALDLERFDPRPGSRTPVRATEEVVEERVPMRLAIRRRAPLELPHAMMLLDDPGHTVLGPLSAAIGEMDLEYTGALMLGGGSVRGWSLTTEQQDDVLEALGRLAEKSPMELGVGDGNHSLAAARRYWEEVRRELPEAEWEDCPARYALVEAVNLWDPALEFEPVHRIVTGVSPDLFLEDLKRELGAGLLPREEGQELRYLTAGMEGRLWVREPVSPPPGPDPPDLPGPLSKEEPRLPGGLHPRGGGAGAAGRGGGRRGLPHAPHPQGGAIPHGAGGGPPAPEDLLHGGGPGQEILFGVPFFASVREAPTWR